MVERNSALGIFRRLSLIDEVASSLEKRVLANLPSEVDALFGIGLAHHTSGDFRAVYWYARVLAVDCLHVGALVNGAIVLTAYDSAKALKLLRRAVAVAPSFVAALANLGFMLKTANLYNASILWLRRVCLLAEPDAHIVGSLAEVFAGNQELAASAQAYRRAIALDPLIPGFLSRLAIVRNRLDGIEESIRLYARCLASAPDDIVALQNLRLALLEVGDVRRAIAIADALAKRTTTLEARLAATQLRIFAEDTTAPDLLNDLIVAQSNEHDSPTLVFSVAARERLPIVGVLDDRLMARTTHATNVLPLVDGLARRGINLVFFTNLAPNEWDDITAQYARCGEVITTNGLTDDQVVSLVAKQNVGILIDTVSHLTGRRSGVIAKRAAPIQIAYAAISSSGAAAMDYVVADHFLLPLGQEHNFRERIIRLPVGYQYRPVAKRNLRAIPPLVTRKFPTFGSFNALAKLNGLVLATWGNILSALPESRLFMKASGLRDEFTRRRFARFFESRGIKPHRIDLVGWTSSVEEHLASISDVDICLDPFPFTGMTTTFDAFSVGVPVPTTKGFSFHSRIGESIANHVEAKELVVDTSAALVEMVVALAKNEEALCRYRTELPGRLLASAICRPDKMAGWLEAGLRVAWNRWTQGKAPDDITVST